MESLKVSDTEEETQSIGPTSRFNEENKMNSTGTQTSFKSIMSPTAFMKAITLPKLAKFQMKSTAPSDFQKIYDSANSFC